jgi:hypothetical protein
MPSRTNASKSTSKSIGLFCCLVTLLLVKDSILLVPVVQSAAPKRSNSPHYSRSSKNKRSQVEANTQSQEPAQLQTPSTHSQTQPPLIYWHEEEEEEDHDTKSKSTRTSITSSDTLQRKRKLIWWSATESEPEPETQPEPHPLRTDVWKLTVRWRQQHRSKEDSNTKKELLLEFADNGYVRLCPQRDDSDADTDKTSSLSPLSAATTTAPIGTWKLDTSGLSWRLPLDDTEHYFFANMHINPFGRYPKMTRGVVIRDPRKSNWFRPVVATFTGVGAGNDTADLSYRHRSGLYQSGKPDSSKQ